LKRWPKAPGLRPNNCGEEGDARQNRPFDPAYKAQDSRQ
jgi:hypothetical protein